VTDVCPHCHAGAMRLRAVTYAAWHALEGSGDERFVIVPHVPAWLCNVCGARFLDADAVAWLAPLLGPTADPDDGTCLPFPRRESERPSLDGDLDSGRAQ
jgi:hypothetical protein